MASIGELTDMILCMSLNAEVLSELGVTLQDAGHQSFQALNTEDAIRFLTYRKVELIIMDESLGTDDGQFLLKEARNLYPRIRIVCWIETDSCPENIIEFDPDVILARSDGQSALLNVISMLTGY